MRSYDDINGVELACNIITIKIPWRDAGKRFGQVQELFPVPDNMHVVGKII